MKYLKKFNENCTPITYELIDGNFAIILQNIKTKEEAIEQLKYWREKIHNYNLRLKVIQNGKHQILWDI